MIARRSTALLTLALALTTLGATSAGAQPAGGSGSAISAPTPIDGVYHVTQTAEEVAAHAPLDLGPYAYGEGTLVLDRGWSRLIQESDAGSSWWSGTFTLRGDILLMTWRAAGNVGPKPAEGTFRVPDTWRLRWSLYRDQLTLSELPGDLPSAACVKPWRRIADAPSVTFKTPPSALVGAWSNGRRVLMLRGGRFSLGKKAAEPMRGNAYEVLGDAIRFRTQWRRLLGLHLEHRRPNPQAEAPARQFARSVLEHQPHPQALAPSASVSRSNGTPAALALFLIVAAVGCTASSSDKAGSPDTPRSRALTMVSGNGSGDSGAQQLVSIVEEAKRLSGGTIRIEPSADWRWGQVAYENGLIRDVRAGKADLGVAGSRAFDSVGVTSLRALHAPFLVDSYALEARVLASPLIPKMLESLESFGLVGLGVLPGPMRKPAGRVHALVEPSDYRGVTIGIRQSRIADETMRALGARPVSYAAGGKIARFGAIELNIWAIEGNRHDQDGVKYVTANANLWPRPVVVFASHKLFDSLTSEQQTLLKRAVAEAVPGAIAAERARDRKSAAKLCRRRVAFVNASEDELAALRRAVQPVYERLEREPETKRFIARIEAMRRQVDAPPDTVRCPAK